MIEPPHHPVRRIAIVSGTALVIAFVVAVLYDSPIPDDADFLLPPVSVADHDNGFLTISALNIPLRTMPSTEDDKLKEMVPSIQPAKIAWDPAFAAKVLDDNAAAMAALRQALASDSWQSQQQRFEDTPEGYSTITPLLRLQSVAVHQAIHLGDHKSAIAHIGDTYRMANLIGRARGSVLGFLLAATTQRHADRLAVSLAPHLTDPQILASLAETVAAHPPDPGWWSDAVRFEYGLIRNYIDEHGRSTPTQPQPGGALMAMLYKPNLTLELYLDLYRETAANATKPNYNQLDSTFRDQLANRPKNWTRWLSLNIVGERTLTETAGVVDSLERHNWKTRFGHRQALLLIALQRYQLDHHNHLPPSLEELQPTYIDSVPLDPYNGGQLHYDPVRRLVWSVGTDLVDDGASSAPTDSIDEKEPAFSIPTPAQDSP